MRQGTEHLIASSHCLAPVPNPVQLTEERSRQLLSHRGFVQTVDVDFPRGHAAFVSESWNTDGLHDGYLRAVSIDGETAYVSASDGPFTKRGAVYRARLGSAFVRCEVGLPEWFPDNVDTGRLDAAAVVSSLVSGMRSHSLKTTVSPGRPTRFPMRSRRSVSGRAEKASRPALRGGPMVLLWPRPLSRRAGGSGCSPRTGPAPDLVCSASSRSPQPVRRFPPSGGSRCST